MGHEQNLTILIYEYDVHNMVSVSMCRPAKLERGNRKKILPLSDKSKELRRLYYRYVYM